MQPLKPKGWDSIQVPEKKIHVKPSDYGKNISESNTKWHWLTYIPVIWTEKKRNHKAVTEHEADLRFKAPSSKSAIDLCLW